MSLLRHIRRPKPSPQLGWWLIRCDCGWEGQTPADARRGPEIEAALEHIYRGHLPEHEARTYLLVDTRAPAETAALDPIVGTFVMPIGDPVLLLRDRVEDEVHFGTYRTVAETEAELPIGEVRTPDGRVFRLDE